MGEEQYVQRIRAMDRPALMRLWERLWNGRKLDAWLPGRAFDLEGAHVIWPYLLSPIAPLDLSGLVEQIDGAIYVDGLSCLVESKHQRQPVSFGPIARFKARLDRRPPGVIGLMFSVSGFTDPALREALRTKWRCAVERGTPDLRLNRLEKKE